MACLYCYHLIIPRLPPLPLPVLPHDPCLCMQMTSCFIHLFPSWLALTLRWCPRDPWRGGTVGAGLECAEGVNGGDVGMAIFVYLLWQVLYYIKTEHHEKVCGKNRFVCTAASYRVGWVTLREGEVHIVPLPPVSVVLSYACRVAGGAVEFAELSKVKHVQAFVPSASAKARLSLTCQLNLYSTRYLFSASCVIFPRPLRTRTVHMTTLSFFSFWRTTGRA